MSASTSRVLVEETGLPKALNVRLLPIFRPCTSRATSSAKCQKRTHDHRPTDSPDDTLDVELAVTEALEGLGFTTELIEVALNLESIETLPSRRPLLVFNLVDAIKCDGRFAPLVPERLDPLGIAYTG